MIGNYLSPFGIVYFKVFDGFVTDMSIDDIELKTDRHPVVDEVEKQLEHYFNHEIEKFNIPIKFNRGTPFEQEVWNALLSIPYGQTRTYQEIANQIGRPKAVRAVGQACKKNPIGIVVPCHRVIGKDGSMRGYSGPEHVDLKQKLIDHEKQKP